MENHTPQPAAVYRVARPTRIVIYGGLAVVTVFTAAWIESVLKPSIAPYLWGAGALLVAILGFGIWRRISERAAGSIHVDDAGITAIGTAGYRALPWGSVARLSVGRRGALEISDASRLVVFSLPRRLENFPELVASVLLHLERAHAHRSSGARRAASDPPPATFSSSVLPEILQALGAFGMTAASAFWSMRVFAFWFLALPVTVWRLSRTPYAITIGPVLRFSTLAWTREVPLARVASIALMADDRGRPAVAIDSETGERAVIVISRLGESPLELYDRLRRLHESTTRAGEPPPVTVRIAPFRAALFTAGCLLLGMLTAAVPIYNGSVLRFAAWHGHESIVRASLTARVPVDSKGTERMTALYLASKAGHLSIVQLLLAGGARPSTPCRDMGFTPLHVAGEYGHVAIVRLLLAAGVQADVRNYWQQTPLWQVAWQNLPTDVEVATILLDAGATVDPADKDGWTPLHIAAKHGNVPVLRLLIEHGASIALRTKKGSSPIDIAILNERPGSLRALTEAGANIDVVQEDGYTELQAAVRHGNLTRIDVLLAGGADPNVVSPKVPPALNLAVQRGHRDLVRALLDAGARPDIASGGYTALQRAAWQGETEMVWAMLDKGANPDAGSATHPPPVIIAAERGHLAVVSLLVDRGAKIDREFQGWTALRAAQHRGHRHVIDYIRARQR